ncbi:programmed cell death protein 2 [Halteromyces radiatus]|uniref:programmed cell death protein 2 n=1 Tax=Halteromyces radiatus TaxID=101107 RepID=UPI00221F0065|nr:programmed cell death protein 2 [Halteromyces radiatus]KAI8100125.1 programmed cell death protein 2 [Halteromyces radiatus]
MSQKKKQSSSKIQNILLGVPDGFISKEEDTDPYITKLGGLPVWLNNDVTPPNDLCRCRLCHDWMYLLCQTYVPLPDSIYHRVIYIWACNRRSCMRKDGSFSVVRSHLVDEDYLRAQQQKEEQKKKKLEQQKKKASTGFGTPQGFQLGDLWGANKQFGSSKADIGSGFGMNKPTTDTLAEKLGKLQLKEKSSTTSSSSSTTTVEPIKSNNAPPVDTKDLPSFPGEYLYITPEDLNKDQDVEIDMSRYQEYLDLEAELLNEEDDTNNEEGTWINEQYEKQQLPRGVDKQFKKFMDRVAYEPSQCIRYEWAGSPLLYQQTIGDQHLGGNQGGKCEVCQSPRVFEMQLMPNVLSILPTSEYATDTQPSMNTSKLDSLNSGMEFGTVLVYVCKSDCHPGDTHDTTFVKELALVQYELD